MAMMRAEVLGPWDHSDPETAEPLASVRYGPSGTPAEPFRMTDITGQDARFLPSDPDLLSVEITCSDVVLNTIEADPDFFVLWSEPA